MKLSNFPIKRPEYQRLVTSEWLLKWSKLSFDRFLNKKLLSPLDAQFSIYPSHFLSPLQRVELSGSSFAREDEECSKLLRRKTTPQRSEGRRAVRKEPREPERCRNLEEWPSRFSSLCVPKVLTSLLLVFIDVDVQFDERGVLRDAGGNILLFSVLYIYVFVLRSSHFSILHSRWN